jgi:DegV family protein with EDD domain
LSSKISGSFNSAIQAREMLTEEERERVFVLDTLQVVSGHALLVLKAIELIQEQREVKEILKEIKNFIPKTHFYVIFQDPKYAEFIGRLSKTQARWIKTMKKIGIQPLIKIKDGKLERGGIVFAKNEAEALFKKVKKESKGRTIRVIINHCDNLEGANELKKLLKGIGAEVSFISEGPPILVVAGPGALMCGWQEIE